MTDIPAEIIEAAQASHKTFWPRGPFVSVTIAQWALESGWGKYASGANNYFGIKATVAQVAAGDYTRRMTKEQTPSGHVYAIWQNFANYSTVEAGFDAHAALLVTPHYQLCIDAPTVEAYCQALHDCGYATDIHYAAELLNIIQTSNLKQFDQTL
jgi:flagellum-specific peptidoglycan hydrolase FlgJ